jgi:iron complex outermembrane receptor protein
LALDDENVNVELQGHWGFGDGRGRLVVGGLYQDESIDSEDPATGRQTLLFEPVDSESEALYGQFDWNVTDSLKLVAAGRWDDSTLHDSQFSPKAAVVYSFNPDHSLRLTYTEAFQVANYSEYFLQAPVARPVDLSGLNALVCLSNGFDCGLGLTPVLALGNESLELEEVSTFEVGYTGILGDRAFLTIDYYNSDNENFITDLLPQLGTPLGRINPNFGPWQAPDTVPAPLQPLIEATIDALVPLLTNNLDGSAILGAASYTNVGQVDTQGVDLGLDLYVGDHWTLSATYSWFDFEIAQEFAAFESLLLPNSPENKVSAGVAYAADRWDLSLDGRWVDEFQWAVGPFQGDVESYETFDLAASFHVSDDWTLGVNVANLFDDEHWESFGGDVLGRRALGFVSYDW